MILFHENNLVLFIHNKFLLTRLERQEVIALITHIVRLFIADNTALKSLKIHHHHHRNVYCNLLPSFLSWEIEFTKGGRSMYLGVLIVVMYQFYSSYWGSCSEGIAHAAWSWCQGILMPVVDDEHKIWGYWEIQTNCPLQVITTHFIFYWLDASSLWSLW